MWKGPCIFQEKTKYPPLRWQVLLQNVPKVLLSVALEKSPPSRRVSAPEFLLFPPQSSLAPLHPCCRGATLTLCPMLDFYREEILERNPQILGRCQFPTSLGGGQISITLFYNFSFFCCWKNGVKISEARGILQLLSKIKKILLDPFNLISRPMHGGLS